MEPTTPVATALPSTDPTFVAYVLAFGAAAAVCFGTLPRVRGIEDDDTRRGLAGLLLTSGGWASAHVGFLVVPVPELKLAFYHIGLIVGLATVGPWLYFCSAYTGRTIHRSTPFRRLAVGVFVAVVGVKLTNPLHHFYFRTAVVATPFPHLAVHSQLLHWVVMGVAYALATVGYFMLLELFWQVGHDTRPLVVLVGLTSLPIVLDILGAWTPIFLEITYDSLGVAVFAVGVLYLYRENFRTAQLTGERDAPVLVLDDNDRVRDYNSTAGELFPGLVVGEPVEGIVPELADGIDADESVVEVNRAGGLQYYQLSTNPFTTGETGTKQVISLTDITERERYRTELERQNERLEQFASVVSHDLRNPLNVARGRLDTTRETGDLEHLEHASEALERMDSLIEDLLTLAVQGQSIGKTEETTLSVVTERAWRIVDTEGGTLTVESDGAFVADPDRLQQLLENLFWNSIDHGSTNSDPSALDGRVEYDTDDVAISVGVLPDCSGFYVADDGPGIPPDRRDEVFEFGHTSEDHGTGFGLAIVAEVVDAHGWQIAITDGADGGARFEIRGVEVADPKQPSSDPAV
jgi:signal transduction histidine kinase